MLESQHRNPFQLPRQIDDAVASALGIRPQNHWATITLKPSQIAAGRGNFGTDEWRADGPWTFWAMNASEKGTADVVGFHEFELQLIGNGIEWQNLPVSARALFAQGLGRRFPELLEGRPLLMQQGDTIEAVFTNLAAGTAINPRVHLIGHRGWPTDWQARGVFPLTQGRPFFHVVRSDTDDSIANGATNSGTSRLSNCYSFSRLAYADGAAADGNVKDFDLTYRLANGAIQTLAASGGTDEDERTSAQGLCGDEGMDLTQLMQARGLPWPQVMNNGDQINWKFFNDSGSTLYPRLLMLGHEGMPMGHVDYFEDLARAGVFGSTVQAAQLADDEARERGVISQTAATVSRRETDGQAGSNPATVASAR